MDQLYFDWMTICGVIGFPNLFITFTCNSNWLEIQRLLRLMHLKLANHPYIVSRIFKIKFDQLMTDLKKKHILGRMLASKSLFHISSFFYLNIIYWIVLQCKYIRHWVPKKEGCCMHTYWFFYIHLASTQCLKILTRSFHLKYQTNKQINFLDDLVKTHMIHGLVVMLTNLHRAWNLGNASGIVLNSFNPPL